MIREIRSSLSLGFRVSVLLKSIGTEVSDLEPTV